MLGLQTKRRESDKANGLLPGCWHSEKKGGRPVGEPRCLCIRREETAPAKMKRVFVDTSALVALFDRKDSNHLQAKAVLESIKTDRVQMLISDYIFDECITTVLSAIGHRAAVTVGEFILSSKIVEITWLDDSVKLGAWDFFKRHSDKPVSFTDCTSFMLMKDLRVNNYSSFDRGFERAGFVEYS